MIGIPLALAYQNVGEWLVHKYLLHGQGKKKTSFWSFHFHEHHRAARLNRMVDKDYLRPLRGWTPQTKEAAGLVGLTLLHLPLAPVAPFFYGTFVYANVRYYQMHKKAHLDPEWGRANLPWHYDHHMGPNQDANWCVTNPWADNWLGTRIVYAGTEKEQRDDARRKERLAEPAAKEAMAAK